MNAGLIRKNQGSGHSYELDGRWIPGVTTVIGSVLDKPALVSWAARETAAYADEHWARLSGMRSADRIVELERARYATNKKATQKGHRIHALAERIQSGETVDVPTEILADVEGVARLLDSFEFETLATEAATGSPTWGYAGTFDALLQSPKFGTCLVDFKSGKRIYDEVAIQLAPYRFAEILATQVETVGPRGGKRREWRNEPMREVDHVFAIHVTPSGSTLYPVKAGPAEFGVFLGLLDTFNQWILRTSYNYRDRGHYDPPIGEAVFPESEIPEGF